jgi:hypothetical protein
MIRCELCKEMLYVKRKHKGKAECIDDLEFFVIFEGTHWHYKCDNCYYEWKDDKYEQK